MLDTTLQAIKSILRTDPTISEKERQDLLRSLRHPKSAESAPQEPVRVLSRAEVALMLGGKSLRFVDYLAAEGKIHRVVLPGRKRAIGYTSDSVLALIHREP